MPRNSLLGTIFHSIVNAEVIWIKLETHILKFTDQFFLEKKRTFKQSI